MPDGPPISFDCGSTPRSEIREVLSRFRASISPETGMPSAQTWYEDVTVYYQCLVTHYWNYVPAMGEYVYAYTTVDGCWITEIVRSGGGGGGGGGSWEDENGEPVAPPSAPYEVPIVADTVCFDSTDDRHILYRVNPGDSAVLQGPLNKLELQDSMRALLLDSYGTIASPLPMGDRRERGAVIVFSMLTDDYSFHRVPSQAGTESHCSIRTVPVKVGPTERIVAWVHTHPIRDFEQYYCPEVSDSLMTADAKGRGGGSDVDWAFADSMRVPSYTIDPDRIWRLEPHTDPLLRPGNPQRWSAVPNGHSAPHAPF
jgi:hypothetical protein